MPLIMNTHKRTYAYHVSSDVTGSVVADTREEGREGMEVERGWGKEEGREGGVGFV